MVTLDTRKCLMYLACLPNLPATITVDSPSLTSLLRAVSGIDVDESPLPVEKVTITKGCSIEEHVDQAELQKLRMGATINANDLKRLFAAVPNDVIVDEFYKRNRVFDAQDATTPGTAIAKGLTQLPQIPVVSPDEFAARLAERTKNQRPLPPDLPPSVYKASHEPLGKAKHLHTTTSPQCQAEFRFRDGLGSVSNIIIDKQDCLVDLGADTSCDSRSQCG